MYGFLRGLSTGVFLRGCAWMSVTDNNTENHEVVLRELSWLPGNKLARFSAAETLEPAPVNLENVTQKLHSMKTPPGKTQSRRVSQCINPRNTSVFSVLVFEYRVLVSEYRRHRNQGTSGAIFEKFWGTPNFFFFMFWVSGGVKYIPKYLGKLLGSPTIHFQSLERISIWQSKLCIFAIGSQVWGPGTWTKIFKSVFLTLLQAKNNIFLCI